MLMPENPQFLLNYSRGKRVYIDHTARLLYVPYTMQRRADTRAESLAPRPDTIWDVSPTKLIGLPDSGRASYKTSCSRSLWRLS